MRLARSDVIQKWKARDAIMIWDQNKFPDVAYVCTVFQIHPKSNKNKLLFIRTKMTRLKSLASCMLLPEPRWFGSKTASNCKETRARLYLKTEATGIPCFCWASKNQVLELTSAKPPTNSDQTRGRRKSQVISQRNRGYPFLSLHQEFVWNGLITLAACKKGAWPWWFGNCCENKAVVLPKHHLWCNYGSFILIFRKSSRSQLQIWSSWITRNQPRIGMGGRIQDANLKVQVAI